MISLDLVDGTTIVVPDSLHLLTPYILQEQGDWFEDEIRFLRQLVQPGETFIDIGANYGVYALSLARCVGPEGQVWAFEPASDTADYLARSIAANATPWIRVEQKALSSKEGDAWLHKPGQSELNSLDSQNGESNPDEVREGERVVITTLDGCMDRLVWSSIDLLKIDAEGEEMRILQGGKRLFRDHSPLVMFEIKEGAILHLDLLGAFEALGYSCYRLVPGLGVLVPFVIDQPVDPYLLNLFAAKPDKASALAARGLLVEELPPPPVHWTDQQAVGVLLQTLRESLSLPGLWSEREKQPGAVEQSQAIAMWVRAKDRTLPAAQRLSALEQSHSLLCGLATPDAPASRWASLARVALELGERGRAVGALAQLRSTLDQGREPWLAEPFLPPHPAYDTIPPGDHPARWLEAAVLEAEECFGSFSGFFTGIASLPTLERLRELGFATPAMERRWSLLQRRFLPNGAHPGEQPPPPQQSPEPVRPWFDFLELDAPLRCLDGGAMGLANLSEPWVRWAQEGCAEVIGFAPLQEECQRLNQAVAHLGGSVRVLPCALGDGEEHTLHGTKEVMTSSLFPPARATVDLFSALGELLQVDRQEPLRTQRLDALAGVRPADFLKLNVQGAELMVLQAARSTLVDVAVVQCEVAFIELYEGQPLMADVDAFLRGEGFCFLKFASLHGRPFQPLRLEAQPMGPISQTLWADAVYVRDFRKRGQWSARQLKAAAFLLHELYSAWDLVSLLLSELDQRQGTDLQSLYLASLLLSEPGLAVE